MDALTNLLACVGKEIFLLSVTVQTNVVPAHFETYSIGKMEDANFYDYRRIEKSTNYAAELVFGWAEVHKRPIPLPTNAEWPASYYIQRYETATNLFPMFTNYIALSATNFNPDVPRTK